MMNGCNITEETARKLESIYVHQVYSSQALSYDDLCDGPWPEIRNFLLSLPSGSLVADVGCGNGKYLNVRSDIIVNGSDICNEFAQLAHKRHKDVIRASNLRLPYRSGSMDAVISVGVLHHIASSQRRLQCITELSRILKPEGKMLIYVWAWEQKWRQFKAQDVLVPWTGIQLKQDNNGEDSFNSIKNKDNVGICAAKKSNKNISLENNGCSLPEHNNTINFTFSCNDSLDDISKSQNNCLTECKDTSQFKASSSIINSVSEIIVSIKEKLRFLPFAKNKSAFDDNIETRVGSEYLDKTCYMECSGYTNKEQWTKVTNGNPVYNSLELCQKERQEDKRSSIMVDGETWNNDKELHHFRRFYHVFRKKELLELVESDPDVNVVYQYYDHGNWTVIAEKL